MKVAIVNGEAEVIVSDDGPYQPSVMRDLCDHAVRVYAEAFDDEDSEKDAPG